MHESTKARHRPQRRSLLPRDAHATKAANRVSISVRSDVPVIMITAYADSKTEANALSRGAAGVLTKPVDFTALILGSISRPVIPGMLDLKDHAFTAESV
jgi:CheY-like chemotaxis protein